MHSPNNNNSIQIEPDPAHPTFGRRRLLKALGITGGALAISAMIPQRWDNPTVQVGYLPAHAQISGLRIFDLSRALVQPLETCTHNGHTGHRHQIVFDYESSFGDVLPGTVVTHAYEFAIGLSGSFDKTLDPADISGDGFQGKISYTVCTAFGPSENVSVITVVSIRTAAGRVSNQVSTTTIRPAVGLREEDGTQLFEALTP